MTISNLITKLNEIQSKNGDLRVFVRDYEGYEEELEDVGLIHPRHKEKTWMQDANQPPFGVLFDC
jgi:hypothetical protein